MDIIESFEHAGKTVKIYRDEDPPNPRKDYDNLSTLVCWHNRMNLGDRNIQGCSEEEFRADAEENGEQILALLPLYLYQHSGISMSTTPFGCRWDSGQVGWAYVTKSSAEKFGCTGDRFEQVEPGKHEKVGVWDVKAWEENIRGEVETYNDYLTGECYGYDVEGKDGDSIDSCWGFVGDLTYVRSEAKSAAEHAVDPVVGREAIAHCKACGGALPHHAGVET